MFIIYFYEKIKFFISYMLKKLKKKNTRSKLLLFSSIYNWGGGGVGWGGTKSYLILAQTCLYLS